MAGLVVQSGGVGIALLEHLSRLGIGVSSFASVGDKYDVSSNDLLTWWEQDGLTRMAVLYVESFGSPRKFARTARRVGQRMPVLTVIGGRSPAGQTAAAASHTAAAATPLVTQEALFGQAGIIATQSLGELVEAAALLASQPLPAGNRVAVVSNAGGAGVLAADACADHGLEVAPWPRPRQRRLRGLLPPGAAVAGPVDTTAAVTAEAFRACLEQVAADDGVDAVLAVDRAHGHLRPERRGGRRGRSPSRWPPRCSSRPSAFGCCQPSGRADRPRADGAVPAGEAATPRSRRLPAYAYPEDAARALGHAARYQAWRGRQDSHVPELDGLRAEDARELIAAFLGRHHTGGWLPRRQASELLACYHIPMVTTLSATSEAGGRAAAAAARRPGRAQGRGRRAGAQERRRRGPARPAHPAGGHARPIVTWPPGSGRPAPGAGAADAQRRRRGHWPGWCRSRCSARWWCSASAAWPPMCSATTRPG